MRVRGIVVSIFVRMHLILSVSEWASFRDVIIRCVSGTRCVRNVAEIVIFIVVVIVRFEKLVNGVVVIQCVMSVMIVLRILVSVIII